LETDFQELDLRPGARLYVNPTDKFKTLSIRVMLQQELRPVATSLGALVPRVLRRGTSELPSMRLISQRLEELYGSRLTAEVSKVGDRQVLMLGLDMPSPALLGEGDDLLRQGVRLLSSVITSPVLSGGTFDERLVEREKDTLITHIESIVNDRTQYALMRCVEEMFKGEPFGLFELGKVDELRAVTPSVLYDHYRTLVGTAPVHAFVVGPVDPDTVHRMLKESLDLPPRDSRQVSSELAPALNRELRTIHERFPIEQSRLVMGFRTHTGLTSESLYSAMVFEGILGGYPHSKLFMNVREKRSLVYYIQSILDSNKGLMFIVAGTSHEKIHDVQEVAGEQIDAIRQGKFNDFEFDATKQAISHRIRSSADSPHVQIGLEYEHLLAGRKTSVAERLGRLEAVDRDQVMQAATRVELDTVYTLSKGGGVE